MKFSPLPLLSFGLLAGCHNLAELRQTPPKPTTEAERKWWVNETDAKPQAIHADVSEVTPASQLSTSQSQSDLSISSDHSTSISEPVWTRIQRDRKIVIGVKADTPPFSVQMEDEFMGFEVELAEAIANSLQVELELIPVSAKQRTPMLLQNKADLILATMTLTRKRDEAIDFSIPYFQVGQGLLLSENSNINSFMDLKNKKTAVLEGTQAFHTLSRVQPDTRLVIVSSYEEGIQKILNKEVHALASDHLLLMGLLFAHESREELRLLGQTFAPDPYGIAMRENESTLRDHINAAIMELWEEGTWHDIYDTWFGEGSMYGHDLMFRIDVIPR